MGEDAGQVKPCTLLVAVLNGTAAVGHRTSDLAKKKKMQHKMTAWPIHFTSENKHSAVESRFLRRDSHTCVPSPLS